MAKRFEYTDIGNAERFVHYYGHDLRYVPKWKAFLTWAGTHWELDTSGIDTRQLAKHCIKVQMMREAKTQPDEAKKLTLLRWRAQSSIKPRVDAMIDFARGDVAVSINDLDRSPWLFNVQNGTLDLRTGKLRDHNRDDLITRVAHVAYNPRARAPTWKKFLQQVLPHKSLRDFVQRFAGYSLTGQVTERMFVICHGGGRNGKSLFIRVLQEMMGPYAQATTPGLLVAKPYEGHLTEVADLYGARLAVASEIKKGSTFDEEKVKRLTGNDVLKARRMHEDPWEFNPTFKLLIAANHKPRVRDATDSFWDRIALIPFEVRIDDKKVDRQLVEKMRKELSGVLTWAVDGCAMWRKCGLKTPSAVAEANAEYRENEDLVGTFIADRCTIYGSGFVAHADLGHAVKEWCDDRNAYPFSERDLGDRLISFGAIRAKQKQVRGWRGVGLNNEN